MSKTASTSSASNGVAPAPVPVKPDTRARDQPIRRTIFGYLLHPHQSQIPDQIARNRAIQIGDTFENPISNANAKRGHEKGEWESSRELPGIPTKKFVQSQENKEGKNWEVQNYYGMKKKKGMVSYVAWNTSAIWDENLTEHREKNKELIDAAECRDNFLAAITKDLQVRDRKFAKKFMEHFLELPGHVFWCFEDMTFFHSEIQRAYGLAEVFYVCLTMEEIRPPVFKYTTFNIVGAETYRDAIETTTYELPVGNSPEPKRRRLDQPETACEKPDLCQCNQLHAQFFSNPATTNYSPDRNGLLEDISQGINAISIECSSRCGCSADCPRRRLQIGQTKRLVVFLENPDNRFGLRAAQEFLKGEFICELTGVVRKLEDGEEKHGEHKVGFEVMKEGLVIDSSEIGNVARFIQFVDVEPTAVLVESFSRINESDPLVPRFSIYALHPIAIGGKITVLRRQAQAQQDAGAQAQRDADAQARRGAQARQEEEADDSDPELADGEDELDDELEEVEMPGAAPAPIVQDELEEVPMGEEEVDDRPPAVDDDALQGFEERIEQVQAQAHHEREDRREAQAQQGAGAQVQHEAQEEDADDSDPEQAAGDHEHVEIPGAAPARIVQDEWEEAVAAAVAVLEEEARRRIRQERAYELAEEQAHQEQVAREAQAQAQAEAQAQVERARAARVAAMQENIRQIRAAIGAIEAQNVAYRAELDAYGAGLEVFHARVEAIAAQLEANRAQNVVLHDRLDALLAGLDAILAENQAQRHAEAQARQEAHAQHEVHALQEEENVNEEQEEEEARDLEPVPAARDNQILDGGEDDDDVDRENMDPVQVDDGDLMADHVDVERAQVVVQEAVHEVEVIDLDDDDDVVEVGAGEAGEEDMEEVEEVQEEVVGDQDSDEELEDRDGGGALRVPSPIAYELEDDVDEGEEQEAPEVVEDPEPPGALAAAEDPRPVEEVEEESDEDMEQEEEEVDDFELVPAAGDDQNLDGGEDEDEVDQENANPVHVDHGNLMDEVAAIEQALRQGMNHDEAVLADLVDVEGGAAHVEVQPEVYEDDVIVLDDDDDVVEAGAGEVVDDEEAMDEEQEVQEVVGDQDSEEELEDRDGGDAQRVPSPIAYELEDDEDEGEEQEAPEVVEDPEAPGAPADDPRPVEEVEEESGEDMEQYEEDQEDGAEAGARDPVDERQDAPAGNAQEHENVANALIVEEPEGPAAANDPPPVEEVPARYEARNRRFLFPPVMHYFEIQEEADRLEREAHAQREREAREAEIARLNEEPREAEHAAGGNQNQGVDEVNDQVEQEDVDPEQIDDEEEEEEEEEKEEEEREEQLGDQDNEEDARDARRALSPIENLLDADSDNAVLPIEESNEAEEQPVDNMPNQGPMQQVHDIEDEDVDEEAGAGDPEEDANLSVDDRQLRDDINAIIRSSNEARQEEIMVRLFNGRPAADNDDLAAALSLITCRFSRPGDVQAVQARLSERNPGLLEFIRGRGYLGEDGEE